MTHSVSHLHTSHHSAPQYVHSHSVPTLSLHTALPRIAHPRRTEFLHVQTVRNILHRFTRYGRLCTCFPRTLLEYAQRVIQASLADPGPILLRPSCFSSHRVTCTVLQFKNRNPDNMKLVCRVCSCELWRAELAVSPVPILYTGTLGGYELPQLNTCRTVLKAASVKMTFSEMRCHSVR
jgi:hypothetical protein